MEYAASLVISFVQLPKWLAFLDHLVGLSLSRLSAGWETKHISAVQWSWHEDGDDGYSFLTENDKIVIFHKAVYNRNAPVNSAVKTDWKVTKIYALCRDLRYSAAAVSSEKLPKPGKFTIVKDVVQSSKACATPHSVETICGHWLIVVK